MGKRPREVKNANYKYPPPPMLQKVEVRGYKKQILTVNFQPFIIQSCLIISPKFVANVFFWNSTTDGVVYPFFLRGFFRRVWKSKERILGTNYRVKNIVVSMVCKRVGHNTVRILGWAMHLKIKWSLLSKFIRTNAFHGSKLQRLKLY